VLAELTEVFTPQVQEMATHCASPSRSGTFIREVVRQRRPMSTIRGGDSEHCSERSAMTRAIPRLIKRMGGTTRTEARMGNGVSESDPRSRPQTGH
jgi:hypothetical protein